MWVVVIVVLVVLVLLWLAVTFNRLVGLRNRVEEGWAGMDVQLQRRVDLVPNLVEVVKGYARHEEGLFARVAEARAATMSADGPADTERATSMLEGALFALFAVAEAYPDLKASDGFVTLQHQLAAVEEEIAFARRYYNATVEDLNTRVETVPTNLVAGPLGFRRAVYFQASAGAGTVPQVGLGQ